MLSQYILVLAVTLWLRLTKGGPEFWVQSFQSGTRQPAQSLLGLAASKSISDIFVAQRKGVSTVLQQHQSIPTHQQHTTCKIGDSRRSLLENTYNSFTVSVISKMSLSVAATVPTSAAYALQPRNEPLCSTGLFENFMEFKCTPIGDIQDEGISKELTNAQEETTNSLLSKLGVEGDTRKPSTEGAKEAGSLPGNRITNLSNQ